MTNCEASHSVPRFFCFLQNERHLESVDKNTPTTIKHSLQQEALCNPNTALGMWLGHTNKLTQKCTETTKEPQDQHPRWIGDTHLPGILDLCELNKNGVNIKLGKLRY